MNKSIKNIKKNTTMAMIIIAFLIIPVVGLAYSKTHDFPRVVAWQLDANKSSALELSRYDTVVLSMNAQVTNADLIGNIRSLNPNVVILAYTSAVEYPKYQLDVMDPNSNGLWHQLGRGIQPEWYLKTYDGKEVGFWPGNVAMNHMTTSRTGQTYAQYLAKFLDEKVLDTGLWDGLFFDTSWETISWHDENIDINNDGKKDTKAFIDQNWHAGQENFIKELRNRAGNVYLVITNGDGQFNSVNNGRMFESFPEFWEGGWVGSMRRYFETDVNGLEPRFNIINTDTNNSGNFNDFSTMRYGLTSTLLGNGYYNFDFGTQDRSFVEYYDEYSVSLGRPISGGWNLLATATTEVAPGVWRRDFENGVSLINSTTQTQTLTLPGEYEKLHGKQDPYVNDGRVVSKVIIPPRDGLVLLRPLEEVLGNVYENGAFARVFSADTRNIRSSFFSYDKKFAGSQKILKQDVDDDGRIETLVADKATITIYADNGLIKNVFYPYGKTYNRGLNFGVGDLNGDGTQEIVTGTGNGGGPQIRIFNSQGKLINPGFFAYATNFRGGVNVTVGDLNGDNVNEIITGAGYGGGPHVRVFNKDGKLINPGFFAYNPAFRGGVNVTVGDINGDGIEEIITGAGYGGGPHVRVWNKDGKILSEFLAFSSKSTAGVSVAAYDFDNDRRDEIVALTTDFFSF